MSHDPDQIEELLSRLRNLTIKQGLMAQEMEKLKAELNQLKAAASLPEKPAEPPPEQRDLPEESARKAPAKRSRAPYRLPDKARKAGKKLGKGTARSGIAVRSTSCGTFGTTWSFWNCRVVGRTSRPRRHGTVDGHR